MPNPTASPAFRRRVLLFAWTTLALAPVIYIGLEVTTASRNFPFWDELDSAVEFILKLHHRSGWRQLAHEFFALNNEHRTVTSRLVFALSYWTTGTVNFHAIGALGNLFIIAACAMLVRSVATVEQRIRLAVPLALLVFQLEHFENFIWSGASIDHFQVVALAVAAFIALARGTRLAFAAAVVFATLATFTLAHGMTVWLLGGLWLVLERRMRRFVLWTGAGGAALLGFFTGFGFNPGHHVPGLELRSLFSVATFWLELLGAPLALGQRPWSALPGVLLIALAGALLARGTLRKSPVVVLTALFGMASLGLVAFGRIHATGDTITSRYMILAAVPWAIVVFLVLEETASATRPYRWLALAAPALAGLNVVADVVFQEPKEAFIEVRDRAATHFKSYGTVGDGISRMYPSPARANEILTAAYNAGVYHLGRVSELTEFQQMTPSTRIVSTIDELVANERALTVGGWAMIPGKVSQRGQVYLVLASRNQFFVYSALTIQRPDIARYYHEPRWRLCGFRAVIGRGRLPNRDYRVGVLVVDGGKAEYLLTNQQVALAGSAPVHDQLASSP